MNIVDLLCLAGLFLRGGACRNPYLRVRKVSRWRDLICRLGHHKRLWYIQKFGAASHVGCPDCLHEIAMHDGLRVAVPWDNEFEQLYKDCGYDVEKFRQLFRARVLEEKRAKCQTS